MSALAWLQGLSSLAGIGSQIYSGAQNARNNRRMLEMEQKYMDDMAAQQKAMNDLNQREFENYRSLDDKTNAAENAARQRYQEELAPFRGRRQEQLNNPEKYYADQVRMMQGSRYGADAAELAANLSHYAPKNSSLADNALRQSIDAIGREATMGFDRENRERERDSYNSLTSDLYNELEGIRAPRENMFNRMQLGRQHTNDRMQGVRDMYGMQGNLARERLASEANANTILPQALGQFNNLLEDIQNKPEEKKLRDLQRKQMEGNIETGAAWREALLEGMKKKKKHKGSAHIPTESIFSVLGL